MKKKIASLLGFGAFVLILGVSCKKDSKSTTPEDPAPVVNNPEFIADSSTFLSFMSWPVQATKKGPSPSLGTAHSGNDTSVTRRVHFKDGQSPVNAKYPVGTVIVKHSNNVAGSVKEIVAMVKRGNNYNPGLGGWEFFILSPSGKIAKDASGVDMRGASLMGGMCGSCHSAASSKDYIFSK